MNSFCNRLGRERRFPVFTFGDDLATFFGIESNEKTQYVQKLTSYCRINITLRVLVGTSNKFHSNMFKFY
jgi:hypothetical protein